MSEEEITGANPDSAYSGGAEGITVAETFTDVVSRFDTATEDLATTLHGPFPDEKAPFRRAYRDFGEEYVCMMHEIQEHGSRLSGNVQAGAIEVARNDDHSAEEYDASEYVNRHLNEEITERYIPEDDSQ